MQAAWAVPIVVDAILSLCGVREDATMLGLREVVGETPGRIVRAEELPLEVGSACLWHR